jgi:magnesium transporter
MRIGRSEERLQASLAVITRLLAKHHVLEALTHRQEGARRDLLEDLQHRQNLAELHARCRTMHPADLAFILETLPPDQRELVWTQVPTDRKGAVLVEVSEGVRQTLVDSTPHEALRDALRPLAVDDLAYLEGVIPPEVWSEVSSGLDAGTQTFLREAAAFPEDSVGHLMSEVPPTLRETSTVNDAIAALRAESALDDHTTRLYVLDGRGVLRGVVALTQLVTSDGMQPIGTVMSTDVVAFAPEDAATNAVKAFERYDLTAAPVIDDRGRLIGQLTVDTVIDQLRAEASRSALEQAGLRGDEDLFAPVLDSARNRWPWLLVNLGTAFVASRVIGAFEHTIAQLVALAALMPIVASVGGNTGNQTVALVIRGLALDQIQGTNVRYFARKELQVSLLNGLLWGGVIGIVAVAFYGSASLGLVMAAAVLLNLLIAAVVGTSVPLMLHRVGRDPAQGSSVLLTFITDSMGFFLFLGLAHLFLV